MSGSLRAVDRAALAVEWRAYVDAAIDRASARWSAELRAGLEGVMAHLAGLSESVEAAQSKRAARASGVPTIVPDMGAMYRGTVDGLQRDVLGIFTRLEAIERGLQRLIATGG